MDHISGQSKLIYEVKNLLKRQKGSWHILLAVGHILKTDDGVGPYIASRLSNRQFLHIIDAGNSPERILGHKLPSGPIAWIVVIDATDFGGFPGEIRFLSLRKLPESFISTHFFPLTVALAHLKERTGVTPRFLGIQPLMVKIGEGLSPPVKQSAEEIIQYLSFQFPPA
ncbi:MAG: hydrogenase maturation protease [Candidatus Omnitrophica bacterium]|nr:hydrogenase maturation protease [Candidatus Omnitrophota bacterium]